MRTAGALPRGPAAVLGVVVGRDPGRHYVSKGDCKVRQASPWLGRVDYPGAPGHSRQVEPNQPGIALKILSSVRARMAGNDVPNGMGQGTVGM